MKRKAIVWIWILAIKIKGTNHNDSRMYTRQYSAGRSLTLFSENKIDDSSFKPTSDIVLSRADGRRWSGSLTAYGTRVSIVVGTMAVVRANGICCG
jgi:hypothetical protein